MDRIPGVLRRRGYYAAAENVMLDIGARLHLGKYSRSITSTDLEKVHGPQYTRFLELKAEHDPAGKFDNQFTTRLLQQ